MIPTLALIITLLALAAVAQAAQQKTRPKLTVRISEAVVATWKCEDKIPRARTRARNPWQPHSHGYRAAELNRWQLRLRACLKQLHAHDDVIRRLQRGLAGTPMSGSEGPLEAAGRRWRISPYFIAAIAGTESSFGAASCRGNPYNAFGLSSCGSGWRVPYFRSWGEAYQFMGAFLTGNTSVTSGWPNARTTYDYHGYAACSACWGRKTAEHMRARFGVGNEVRYP